VLDVSPSLHGGKGAHNSLVNSPPLSDAVVVPLWENEAVHQLIHIEDPSYDRKEEPNGVVLAVVGPPDQKGYEPSSKVLRIYNISSLVSLVRWAVAQKVSDIGSSIALLA
jgi:hypothetical protein